MKKAVSVVCSTISLLGAGSLVILAIWHDDGRYLLSAAVVLIVFAIAGALTTPKQGESNGRSDEGWGPPPN